MSALQNVKSREELEERLHEIIGPFEEKDSSCALLAVHPNDYEAIRTHLLNKGFEEIHQYLVLKSGRFGLLYRDILVFVDGRVEEPVGYELDKYPEWITKKLRREE